MLSAGCVGWSSASLLGYLSRRMKNSPEKAIYMLTSLCIVCLLRRSIPNSFPVSVNRH